MQTKTRVKQLGIAAAGWLIQGAIAPLLILLPSHTLAQNITFDGTLGAAGTLQAQPAPGNLSIYTIPQYRGQVVGSNLFHSFSQFNLNPNEQAFFQSTPTLRQSTPVIRNIFVRVTGEARSTIDGQIVTNQLPGVNVNVFFINPKGITFGPHARIDGVTGSFVATTLDAIEFPNGRFSAVNPNDGNSLLTLVGDPSGFLASQRQPGDIQISRQNTQISNTDVGTQGLSVRPGRSLIFLGGNITLNDAAVTINQPSGLGRRMELGGVTAAGTVGLTTNATGFSLQFPDAVPKADIALNRSQIEFTTSRDSSLALNARNLSLTDSRILIGNGTGGEISLNAENLTVANSDIALQVQGGNNLVSPQGGTLRLTVADTLTVTNNSILSSEVQEGAVANGGDLEIHTQRLVVQNSQVRADTFGIGNAGNLTIDASESVELSGDYARGEEQGPGGVFAQVNSTRTATGVGHGGNLTVVTPFLSVREGSKVQAATFGQGDAGSILIQAQDVEVIDTAEIPNQFPTAINAGATLTLIPEIDARGELRGNGGNLTIQTDRLRVQSSEITVENFGVGAAGRLDITAQDSVHLSDRAHLTAQTRSGQGGDITLNVNSLLFLQGNSQISTTAGTAQAGGDGGNITINAPTGFVVGAPLENSDITANAFSGSGGRVTINAQGIFDLVPRSKAELEQLLGTPPLDPQRLPTNDITASSEFGISGTVTLNILNVDPSRGLVALPTNLTDPSQQIAQSCNPGSKTSGSSFVATGRGGLPLNPDEPLESRAVVTSWVPLPEEARQIRSRSAGEMGSRRDQETGKTPHSTLQSPLVEAQGWVVKPDGTVELTANLPSATPARFWMTPAACQVAQGH